jgi:D-amino-acid dehydrogenase
LKNECARLGGNFNFNTEVVEISPGSTPTLRLSNGDTMPFDAVLLCVGDQINQFTNSLCLKTAAVNMSTLSVSARIREPLNAPRGAITDLARRTVITRIGGRVRISGGTELSMATQFKRPAIVQKLYQSLQALFPTAVHYSYENQVWKGHQCFTQDGLPSLGLSSAPGVWLNTGHGANGLTLAHGSARAVADLIGGKSPAIDIQRFLASR